MRDVEELAEIVIDCGYKVHRDFGPGLFESVYETVMADKLRRCGLVIECQKPVDIEYEGHIIRQGFRIDILVESALIVEIKAVEALIPVHKMQVLTYLRLMNQPLGLVMNFGGAVFKDNTKRVPNNYVGRWKTQRNT